MIDLSDFVFADTGFFGVSADVTDNMLDIVERFLNSDDPVFLADVDNPVAEGGFVINPSRSFNFPIFKKRDEFILELDFELPSEELL